MIKQIYKTICYGCNACQSVCPQNAITMVEDAKGFLVPVISNACISCGKCVQVCRQPISLHQVRHTYIGKLLDQNSKWPHSLAVHFQQLPMRSFGKVALCMVLHWIKTGKRIIFELQI